MARRKTPPDIGKLADDANAALGYLVDEGYEKEVQIIRTFLIEQGEHWKRIQRTNREVASKLSRDLKVKREREAAPTPQ